MNKKQIRPFGVKDEIGYVFGDMAGSFVNLFVDAYFLIFCTNVLGISAGWMGTLFLVARLWDAINDPIMGSFPDRWMIGKSGDKFKPWIKIFMLPLALSGVLCFFNVPLEGIALHAYVAFAYVLYGMSYTGTSMPFGAMASVVSDDPIQRSKLSRARSIGGTIVGIVGLSIVPVVCFDKQSNILPERFTLIAVIFGVLSIISYFVLLNFTQERIRQNSEKAEKFNYGKVLKATVHNRPLVPKLVAKFGKKATLMAAIVSSTIFSVIPVVMEIKNVYIYSALVVLGTIGQTVFTMLIWALVTDCLDYSEWKFNERSDGSMYSLYTFSRKIGSTIASTGVSFGLAAIGFVSGSNVVQTAEAVNGIYFLVNIIPVVTCILELVGVGLIFNLNKETTERMYAELKAK